jgi:hypothetical protein
MNSDFEAARAHLATRIARWTEDSEHYATAVSGLIRHFQIGQSRPMGAYRRSS